MKKYDYDVSICIPYAEDWPHLYFTLTGIVNALVWSKLSHEIIVVINNKKDPAILTQAKKSILEARDFVRYHNLRYIEKDYASNAQAANEAAANATGKHLCFTDSHVSVFPNIFTECIKVLEQHEDAGMVHSPITWNAIPHHPVTFDFIPGGRCYQYRYRTWKKGSDDWYLYAHFHGTYNHSMQSPNPYPIAGCGHGFFMMRHDVWKKVGGYHTKQKAYGGREPYLTFKCWLFGYRNFTVPTTNHTHYNGRRLYHWNMDMWYENCMQQAYSVGGDEWLDRIYDRFKNKKGVKPHVIKKLREAAVESSKEARKFVLDNQKIEFGKPLFKLWDETGVYY